jgi:hypothetical protein
MPVDLDGTDYYYRTDTDLRMSGGAMSAHAWVDLDAGFLSGVWMAGSQYWWLFTATASSTVGFQAAAGTFNLSSDSTLPASGWTSIGASFVNASRGRVYVNGTQKESSTAVSITATSGERFDLGRGASAVYSNGRVAHFALWSVELTAAEFGALAAGTHPLKIRPGSIVACWLLDNDIGLTVDSGPNGKTLTSSGSPTNWTTDEPIVGLPSTPRPPTSAFRYARQVALRSAYDGAVLTNPTIADGDFKISKNGGTLANLTVFPTVEPTGSGLVTVELTSAEMTADVVTVIAVDQTNPKEWADEVFSLANIEVPI